MAEAFSAKLSWDTIRYWFQSKLSLVLCLLSLVELRGMWTEYLGPGCAQKACGAMVLLATHAKDLSAVGNQQE